MSGKNKQPVEDTPQQEPAENIREVYDDIPTEWWDYTSPEQATQGAASIITAEPIATTQKTSGSNAVTTNVRERGKKNVESATTSRKDKGKGVVANSGVSIRKTPPRAAKSKVPIHVQEKTAKGATSKAKKKLEVRRAPVIDTQSSQVHATKDPMKPDQPAKALSRPNNPPGSSTITQEVRFSSTPQGNTYQTFIGSVSGEADNCPPACKQM